jgi:hypothetical protein
METRMRKLGTALLGLAFWHPGQAMADVGESWPALEEALRGPLVQVEATKADPRRFKIPGVKCPKIPIEDFRAYTATVRFEPSRTLKMEVLVGRLPTGFDVYGPIVAAAHDPASDAFLDGCLMPKSGLSLLQLGRYLLEFPTVCSEIYPYKKSLPIVVKALQESWGTRLPKKFIYAPCGTMYPRLVDVDEYLRAPQKPRKGGSAAQPGVAPVGRPQTAARR